MKFGHDSMTFGESLTFSNGVVIPKHTSGRLIGEVTINEYDALGRKVFSDVQYNDVMLPGSVFALEQMFKVPYNNTISLTHGGEYYPTYNSSNPSTLNPIPWKTPTTRDLGNQKIFGFMIGYGGENGATVNTPEYNSTNINNGGNPSFMPFIKQKTEITNGNYCMIVNANNEYMAFAKKFSSDPEIHIVEEGSSANDVNTLGDNPVLAYAQCKLSIDSDDTKGFFENNDSIRYINQVGLVAGLPTANDYVDVRLITCINFKTRDLSGDNSLEMIYRIYCL